MGFNEAMTKKVYLFLKPRTIDEAIELMSEADGIYQHDFYNQFHNKKHLTYSKIPSMYSQKHLQSSILFHDHHHGSYNLKS